MNFKKLLTETVVSVYNAKYYSHVGNYTFIEALTIGNTYKRETIQCREIEDKTERRKFKTEHFCTFTPHASFNGKRQINRGTKSTNIIGIDIDAKGNEQHTPDSIYSMLINDPYIGLIQETCSGWVVCYIAYEGGNLNDAYTELEAYFKNTYEIEIDPACKDYTRCRYINWSKWTIQDREVETYKVVNHNAEYDIENLFTVKPKKTTKKSEKEVNDDLDEQFKSDLYMMDMFAFLKKYKTLKLKENNKDEFEFNSLGYAKVEGEFIEIKRKITRDEQGIVRIKKWYDGEQRRHYLTKVAAQYKAIHGDKCTLQQMVYSLIWELSHFINNDKDEITKNEIIGIALWAMGKEVKKYASNKKYIVADTMKANSRTIVGIAKRQSHYQHLDGLVDPAKTFDENLKAIKATGEKISAHCLTDYYADRGLAKKTNNDLKQDAIRALWVSGDTASELAAKCKDNDIKVSLPTLYKYIDIFEAEVENEEIDEAIEEIFTDEEAVVDVMEKIIAFYSLKNGIDEDEAYELFLFNFNKAVGEDFERPYLEKEKQKMLKQIKNKKEEKNETIHL